MAKRKSNKSIFSASIPQDLEQALIAEYKKVIVRYKSGDFEHHETSVGKFCEVVLRILEYNLRGTFTPIDDRISDTGKIINEVINSESIDESARKRLAPLIKILLGFRNERDAAHVGGVDLESIDTNFTFYATRWIYAELVRIYGDMEVKEMQKEVDTAAEIAFPDLLKVGNKTVIVNPNLTSEKEVLLSLRDGEKFFEELFEMNKEQNKARFKRKLSDMEKQKLIYLKESQRYHLLPAGRSESAKFIR